MSEVLDLLNSLGIAGPNIPHVEEVGPDPKWSPEEMDVYRATRHERWCVCGRLWPCEAKRLADLLAASQPSPSAVSGVGATPAAATDSDRLAVDVDARPDGVAAFQQLADQAAVVHDSSEDASKGLHADKYQAVTAQPSPSAVPERREYGSSLARVDNREPVDGHRQAGHEPSGRNDRGNPEPSRPALPPSAPEDIEG